MKLSKNFTLNEMQKTATGLANVAPAEAQQNLRCLCCKVLQPLRDKYGKPIYVNSGYRSEAVNKAVDGAPTSRHMKGQAADITGGSITENKRLFELIRSSELPFDQLIDERNYRWLHVSYRNDGKNRQQILHLK